MSKNIQQDSTHTRHPTKDTTFPSVPSNPTPVHTSTPTTITAKLLKRKNQKAAKEARPGTSKQHTTGKDRKRGHRDHMEMDVDQHHQDSSPPPSPKRQRLNTSKPTVHRDPLTPTQQTEEMENRLRRIRRKKGMTATATEESQSPKAVQARKEALTRAMTGGKYNII